MRIILIVAGLHGFAFTLLKAKPPGPYLFACAVILIGAIGSVLSNDKQTGALKVVAAALVAIAAQQLLVGFLASETSRLWLTWQFVALEAITIGAMLPPKRRRP